MFVAADIAENGRAVDDRPLLSFAGVTKRFAGVAALSECTIDVRGGEVVGLIGPNGSGKSTLLRLAAGLVRPTTGLVLVAGFRAGSAEARGRVAFVPDEPSGFAELTVAEHVSLVAALSERDGRLGPAVTTRLGLEERLHQRVGTLSHGLRRRAALAAAFAGEPEVLLLDEVTAPLDSDARGEVSALLREFANRGGAVVAATHDSEFIRGVCDRVVVLRGGRVAASGPQDIAETLVALAGLSARWGDEVPSVG